MKLTSRKLVLAVLVPLLAGTPIARADFLIANPSPAVPDLLPTCQVPTGAPAQSPVVYESSRTPEPAPADNDSGSCSDWRETMVANYGLFLLTLFGGHAPPPPPDGPPPVISSSSGGGGSGGGGGGGPGPTPNPEPATVILSLLGGCGLTVLQLRKRRMRRETMAN
jgi:hypothetical protein